jgi:hypothetical protein
LSATTHPPTLRAAEEWFNALPAEDTDTWEHLGRAFKRKWPSKTPTVKTVEEKQAALEQTRISEEEVGKRVTTNGVEELAHVVWADKIERLMAAIPDANSLLVNTIRKSMPKVLQKVTGSGHTTWASFCSAVRAATVTQIAKAKEEEKEARDLQEQVRRLQELRETSAWDVTNALQWLTINTPSPIPHFPILRTQPPNAPNYPPAPTFNTNNQPSAHATKHQISQHTDRTEPPPSA